MIHEGGLVPKTLYKMNSLEDHDDDTPVASRAASASRSDVASKEGKRLSAAHQHDHKNLYKTVDLKPGFTHELLIRNSDPKSVLTWDFDVLRNDLHFTLYRITEELPDKHGEFGEYPANSNGYIIIFDIYSQMRLFPTSICRTSVRASTISARSPRSFAGTRRVCRDRM